MNSENNSVKDSTPTHQLTFHIVDCAMRNPDGKYVETYPAGIERLVILDDENVNFGASLSKEWFKRARGDTSGVMLKSLKGCFRSAYKIMKRHGVTSSTFMFTTFTAYKELLQYAKRWAALPYTETFSALQHQGDQRLQRLHRRGVCVQPFL